MFRTTLAADTGGSSAAAKDVQTELTALSADVRGLAESVQRLAAESPSIAQGAFEEAVRRDPLRSVLIAAGIGFVVSLILTR